MTPLDRQSGRVRERDIMVRAAKHAVAVHGQPETRMTPYGLAHCAASMALVLTDESHPNHRLAWEQTEHLQREFEASLMEAAA